MVQADVSSAFFSIIDRLYGKIVTMDFNAKKFFKRFYQKAFIEEDIFSSAAQVGFYFSFALFPLLLFLVTLFGFFLESADSFRQDMFFYLQQVMPPSAYELVRTTIDEITENSTGGKLTIGILIALWSASAGMDSLRIALNSVYKFSESRSLLRTKALSLSMTLLLTLLITLVLILLFYGWQFISFVLEWLGLPIPPASLLMIIQWAIILGVLVFVFQSFYNILPDRTPRREWLWITPGAVVGIVLWLLASNGFSLYLSYFNSYDKFYGSIGAVIILMLWLYLTALVILIGGMINRTRHELAEERERENREVNPAKTVIDEPAGPETAGSES